MALNPAPEAKTLLGRHRVLSPTAGVKVSPLCLGAMNFGDAWKAFMGDCNKDTVFQILDTFHEKGGNFIDTANNYQDEESETWIGEWLTKRGVRDEMVIATKFTTGYSVHHGHGKMIHSNFGGNHSKSLKLSLDASLKKLQTDYLDILYVHWWDFTTSIEELMLSLNDVVKSGKVLYLGVSDTPAWIVSRANQYARDHGLRQFVIYQGKWNASIRDFERDIIPMCKAEGMAMAPWAALGGGHFKTAKQWEEMEKGGQGRRFGGDVTENEKKVSAALEKVADAKGTGMTSVALAYVMHKAPYVYPIIGGRNTNHMQDNIDALGLELSPKDIEAIEAAIPFDPGFPLTMLSKKPQGARGPGDVWLTEPLGTFDYVDDVKPIAPRKQKK